MTIDKSRNNKANSFVSKLSFAWAIGNKKKIDYLPVHRTPGVRRKGGKNVEQMNKNLRTDKVILKHIRNRGI